MFSNILLQHHFFFTGLQLHNRSYLYTVKGQKCCCLCSRVNFLHSTVLCYSLVCCAYSERKLRVQKLGVDMARTTDLR